MPKNSRPDIQVLEERIVRLKAQLLEFKELRLYGVTKKRLSVVSTELTECLSIIDEIVNSTPSGATPNVFDEKFNANISEFANDGDLLDTFLLTPSSANSETVADERYSARDIVKTYSERMQACADCSTGIIQINQFCQLMNSWYQARFTPAVKNPHFFFKASRIHEWIDLLMISAGDALHKGIFPAFVSDIQRWIEDLNTPKDESYLLPYSVMQMKDKKHSSCTQEAVLIELIVKSTLYDSSFYGEDQHSIRQIVLASGRYTEEDLKVQSILSSCPKLIVTSSFDISKYQEESDV